ncbi:hypothetical protein EI983_17895 [Roseovarius faecimaris]|uniref:Uncharacterized protein n=1 Tax=Roseovarius faecimaris TaxID=2494550 RepID=A0A6I6IX81_9RHOB|nr:hypothetical protein [Roseovarius faecimaris]QGY00038.1 hypothetical protein EI983_17895 [Roseovarius faecimaris]
MTQDTAQAQSIGAACLMLITVQGIMLASLYFDVAPHPPRVIPLFAMPPFLAVSIGTALCAMRLTGTRMGNILAGLAALFALLSFGPQKYFDPAFPEIWIAVIASQLSVLAILYALVAQREPS